MLFFACQHGFCGVSSAKIWVWHGLAMSDDVRVFLEDPSTALFDTLFDTGTAKAAPFTYGVARSHEVLHGGETKHKDVPCHATSCHVIPFLMQSHNEETVPRM